MIFFEIEHLRNVYPRLDEREEKHFHIGLACGATVQAEMVVLGKVYASLYGIREHRPLLGCKADCETCVLQGSEAVSVEAS